MCVCAVHWCRKWIRKRQSSLSLSLLSSPLLLSLLFFFSPSSSHLHLPMTAIVRFLRRFKHHIPAARVVVRSTVEKDGRTIPETKRVPDVLGPGGESGGQNGRQRGISRTLACVYARMIDLSSTPHTNHTTHTHTHTTTQHISMVVGATLLSLLGLALLHFSSTSPPRTRKAALCPRPARADGRSVPFRS